MGKIRPKFNKELPENWKSYFDPEFDNEFKKEHKVAYGIYVFVAICALLVPLAAFAIAGVCMGKELGQPLALLGLLGAFIFSIGLFNIVSAFIGQYLGHKVTIVCLTAGFAMPLIVLLLL
ncbi:MAG: hypothetical protein KID04_12680 [Clostridium sp.]|nr:hypothetical protein [Clostridium sp.]